MPKRTPKILHIVRQYIPSVGGLEEHVQNLVRLQSEQGPVFLLTFNRIFGKPGKLPSIERHGRVVVIRVPLVGYRRAFLPLVSRALINRFDLVHVHGLDQWADLVSLLRRRGGPPFVVTTHGLFFHTERQRRLKALYFSAISRRSLSNAAHVFAVSRNDQARLREIGIESIHVRNPVTPFDCEYRGGSDLIYVGRFSENKNLTKLIPFAAELRRRGWSHKLHIVGEGDDRIRRLLEASIAFHGLEDIAILHGYVERDAVAALLPRCGYAVSASRYEGYGMAMVEAMSAGLLPVMHPNSGFRELNNECPCGLLVDFENPERAAADFLEWQSTATEGHRTRARSHALGQSWRALATLLEGHYAESLDHARPAVPSAGAGIVSASTPLDGHAVRRIAGVDITVCDRATAIDVLADRLKQRRPISVAFANTNLIVQANERPDRLSLLQRMLVLNDGVGVDIASKILFGRPFPDNLNGTDFTPALLKTLPSSTRVFLYGARPHIVSAARDAVEAKYGLTVCGAVDGYGDDRDVVGEINRSRADVVLVALGNPKQEEWIARHRHAIAAPVVIGVGALFDFLAGAVPRAPLWVQRFRIEWAFRLFHEPKRLVRRYTIDIARFMTLVLRQRFAGTSTHERVPSES